MPLRRGEAGQAPTGSSWSQLSRVWKVLWGAIGGVAMLVGLALAVPEAHERMCTGTPWWQSWGTSLSLDCTAYAQKTTPVDLSVLSPPKTKSEVRAEKAQFDLRRFFGAVQDGDREELDKLYAEGWRLKPEVACGDFGLWNSHSRIALLHKFAQGPILCDAGYGPVDGPAYLLHKYWGYNECWHKAHSETISLIDGWVAIKPSKDLRQIANRLLKAYAVAEKAPQNEIEALCKRRHADGNTDGVSIFRDLNESEFHDAVFSFSASCEVARDRGNYVVRSLVGIDKGIIESQMRTSSRNGAPPESMEDRIALECNLRTKRTGVHPKAAYMKDHLLRWAK
jgi:hypothetical protein